MHVGIDREDEMEPTGGDIFPIRFSLDFTEEEQKLIDACRAYAQAAHIFFETTTAMLMINTMRELKNSNKLRSDSGTII